MVLKPQDIVILLKLVASGEIDWSYPSLAHDLFMSASEIHAGIKRAGADVPGAATGPIRTSDQLPTDVRSTLVANRMERTATNPGGQPPSARSTHEPAIRR